MSNNKSLRRFTSGTTDYQCGQEAQRRLKLSGCAKEEDCNRSYYLYLPKSRCDETILVENDVLPLVFALHCFGCGYSQMSHWGSVAEEFSFVLVIPEGLERSWNARYCCGYALKQNLNDVGFLESIMETLSSEFSFVSKDVAYAMGWSNGGYMAAYAANLFRAVAPIAGHDYDPFVAEPTALFLHHSLNDPYVRFTGCCTNSSMPTCCCGISDQADQCTSTMQVFETFASQINHCKGGTIVSLEDDSAGITCHTGVDCMANTTLCVHRDGGHFNSPSFQKAFPMTDEIADFFARDACSINDGNWSEQGRSCACRKQSNEGSFCLASGFKSSAPVASTSVTTPILVLVLVALLGPAWLAKNKARYVGWSRLATSDVEMVDRNH